MTVTYNDLASLREQKDNAENALTGKIAELKAIEVAIRNATNSGNAPSGDLIAAQTQLRNEVNTARDQRDGIRSDVGGALGDYLPKLPKDYVDGGGQMVYDYETIWNMNGDYPILMMPLKIETRFLEHDSSLDKKLWLRIYPDDIWIKDHEHKITIKEYKAGKIFLDNGATKEAWEVLCNNTSHTRAAWVVKVTEQLRDPNNTSWNKDEDDSANVSKFAADPYTQAKTNLLPERFRVHIYWRFIQTDPSLIEDYVFSHYHDIKVPFGFPARDELKVTVDPDFQYKNIGGPQAPFTVDPGTGNITFENDLLWIYDFEDARKKGMADRIEIYNQGPGQEYRIVVVGVRETMSITDSTAALKDLFNDHRYTDGLALLKQGQHTKNADNTYAGYATYDLNSDIIYKAEFSGPLYTKENALGVLKSEKEKSDGQILAEALGFEPEFFNQIYNSDQTDINNFSRVNNFLWETFGGTYLKDQRLVTSRNKVALSRAYVIKYAMSRGRLPGFRIGDVPYGIIPTSDMTGLQTAGLVDDQEIVAMLKSELDKRKSVYWDIGKRLGKVGSENGDSAFAGIVGKHAVPQELYQRNVVGPGYIWNELIASGNINEAQQWIAEKKAEALGIMNDMGITGAIPPILQKSYLDAHQLISTPIVCEHENDERLPNIPGTDINYLQWLSQANINELLNHDYTRFGAAEGTTPPNSVLYVLAHNSILMEYWTVAADILEYGDEEREIAEMVNILPNEEGEGETQFENMEGYEDFKFKVGSELWIIFDKTIAAPDGNLITVGQYIEAGYASEIPSYATLGNTRGDLGSVGELPAGDIGGVVHELIALYTYRFDSWELSMIEWQLSRIRGRAGSKENSYIGAYGWVTDLKPRTGTYSANSQGYILGPSLTHAGAGALIKSAHSASNDPTINSEVHDINLSSERSRIAMNYIEGINNGQEIGALLGYEFERGLHELSASTLNKYILPFRNAFPILSPTNNSTTLGESVSPRNVVNGKDLLLAYRDSSNNSEYNYFFGKIAPFATTATERTNIIKVMKKLDEHLDALADLSESEAAFQIINENIERAGAFAEGITGSKNIPDAQILETPASGQTIVNKVTLHLDSELGSFNTAIPWGGTTHLMTKANIEPAIHNWLARLLPPPQNITFRARVYTNNPTKTLLLTRNFTINSFLYTVWDALAITNHELDDENNELIGRAIFFLTISNRLDDTVTFEWDFDYVINAANGDKSVSEVYYLLKKARVLMENSRPLKASDYYSSSTPKTELDAHPAYDKSLFSSQFSFMVANLNQNRATLGNKNICTYLNTFANLDIGLNKISTVLVNTKSSAFSGNGTAGNPSLPNDNSIKPFWGAIESKDREGKAINKFSAHFKNNLERVSINNVNYSFDSLSSNSFTIAAWVQCEDAAYPSLNYGTIFAHSDATDYNQNVIVGINNRGIPFCQYSTYYYESTANSFRDGQPHHLAIVIDKTSVSIKFYVDSLLINTFPLGGAKFLITQANFNTVNGEETYQSIGWTNIYENESSFMGKIADLAIWNIALTDVAVSSNRYEIDSSSANLIANWQINEVFQIEEVNKFFDAMYLASEYNLNNAISGFVPKNDVERFRFFQRCAKTAVTKLIPLQSPDHLTLNVNSENYLDLVNKEFKKYYGNNFTVLPRFQFSPTTLSAILKMTELATQTSMLKLAGSATANDCNDKAYGLIEGMGRVNNKINTLEVFNNLVYGLSGANPFKITALQFPYLLKQVGDTVDDLWVSLDMSAEASAAEIEKMFSLSRVSIAAHFTPAQLAETGASITAFGQPLRCGFMVEEWTEVIPDEYVSGGVSFHYDKPLAKAPQALILAVPPYKYVPGSGGYWRRDTLRDSLVSTFDLSIMRAVDYEDIATSAHIRAKSVQALGMATAMLNHHKGQQM